MLENHAFPCPLIGQGKGRQNGGKGGEEKAKSEIRFLQGPGQNAMDLCSLLYRGVLVTVYID